MNGGKSGFGRGTMTGWPHALTWLATARSGGNSVHQEATCDGCNWARHAERKGQWPKRDTVATKTKKAEEKPSKKAPAKKASKSVAEETPSSETTSTTPVAGVGITRVDFEVSINAPVDRVWYCLTRETSNWWPRDFYTSERTRRFVIMAKLGGLVGEDFGMGGGVIWYKVIGVAAPTSLTLLGHLTPTFGGPSMSTLEITLEPQNGTTVFRVVDAVLGPVTDGLSDNLLSGWKTIFGEGLKKWIESGGRMGNGAPVAAPGGPAGDFGDGMGA